MSVRLPSVVLVALAIGLAGPARAQTTAPAGDATCGHNVAPAPPDPTITAAEVCASIAVLAADSLEGREAGTPGAEKAAAWIADRFAAAGLEPLGDDGSWLQRFSFPAAVKRDPHAARETGAADAAGAGTEVTANVVGVVRGTDPALAARAVVVGAHYDHLGRGISGSLAPAGTHEIHNGADDNASGVAGVVELAERYAADPPRRSIVFVAFGGEEEGDLGSQHWVKDPPWPLEETVAMINLDMIGRLRDELTVYGTGTSPAWPELLDEVARPGDPEISRVPDGYGPSDHASFYGARVPVLAFFTGTHEQYHRPEDDVDLIRSVGEVRVLDLVARVVDAVARTDLAVPWTEAPTTQRRAAAFKVALGVVPDYGYAGEGLALSSIRPGGPAEAAGLKAGDVIVRMAGRDVGDIYDYTEILAGLEADQEVEVVYRRDGETRTTTVRPEAL